MWLILKRQLTILKYRAWRALSLSLQLSFPTVPEPQIALLMSCSRCHWDIKQYLRSSERDLKNPFWESKVLLFFIAYLFLLADSAKKEIQLQNLMWNHGHLGFKTAILALFSGQKCICINQACLQTCSLGRAQNGARTQVTAMVWQHNVPITQGHARQNWRTASQSCASAPCRSAAQSCASA